MVALEELRDHLFPIPIHNDPTGAPPAPPKNIPRDGCSLPALTPCETPIPGPLPFPLLNKSAAHLVLKCGVAMGPLGSQGCQTLLVPLPCMLSHAQSHCQSHQQPSHTRQGHQSEQHRAHGRGAAGRAGEDGGCFLPLWEQGQNQGGQWWGEIEELLLLPAGRTGPCGYRQKGSDDLKILLLNLRPTQPPCTARDLVGDPHQEYLHLKMDVEKRKTQGINGA